MSHGGSISFENGHKKGWASTFHKRKERGFAASIPLYIIKHSPIYNKM